MEHLSYSIILHFITLLTILVQIYVIFLVQYKSPKSMQEYRWFLNMFTIYDMLFTIALGVGLQPDAVPGQLACVCRGLAHYIGPWGELYVLGFTLFFGSNMIIAQDYCLIYRYTVIHKNRNVHPIFISNYFKIGWFIFAQSISVPLGIYMYKTCYTPEEYTILFSNQAQEVQELIYPHKFVMRMNLDQNLTYIYMGTMLVLFAISECLCITLIYLIMSTLKKNIEVFSRNTYRLHLQLTVLLGFQLMTPFIFVLLPLTVGLIAAFMGKFSARETGQIGYIMIEMYGITNAIFTIIFIGPFRTYTFDAYIHPWLKSLININPLMHRIHGASIAISSTFVSGQRNQTNQNQFLTPNCGVQPRNNEGRRVGFR